MHVSSQKSLVARACVCEHANDEGGERAQALGATGELVGAEPRTQIHPLSFLLARGDVALLETSSIWGTLVSQPNVFLAPGVK